jgi:hypothetical protein
MYKLFIDDEREPPTGSWITARSFADVKRIICALGWPTFVSFDHDLGEGQPSGKHIANWLVDCDLAHRVLPADFGFTVHSQNPVGAANIALLLTPYFNQRNVNENSI